MGGLRDQQWYVTHHTSTGTLNRLRNVVPGNAVLSTVRWFSGETSPVWKRILVAGISDTDAGGGENAPTGYGANGWEIVPYAGLDGNSYMHDDSSGPRRFIPQGQWNVDFFFNGGSADLQASWKVGVNIFKRLAADTNSVTFVQQHVTGTPFTISPGAQSRRLTFTVPKFYIEPTETLLVELWMRGRATAFLQQNIEFRRGSDLAGATPSGITLPGVIGNTYTASADDVAPVTDGGIDEKYHAIRPVEEVTALTESNERIVVNTRAIADTHPTNEDVEPQVHLYRANTEILDPATDTAARAAALGRAVADSAPATEAVALSYDGGRQIADTIPTTEQVVRAFVGARSLQDAATSADVLDRVFRATREPVDVTAVSEAVAAVRVSIRRLTDSAPATDALARKVSASRPVSDAVAEGGGDIIVKRPTYIFDD